VGIFVNVYIKIRLAVNKCVRCFDKARSGSISMEGLGPVFAERSGSISMESLNMVSFSKDSMEASWPTTPADLACTPV